MTVKLPTHWSGWLLCAGLLAFTLAMARYCLWCHVRIERNGGYLYSAAQLFGG